MNATGQKRPYDAASAKAENSAARTAYDTETEGDLKRLSRTLDTAIVAGGWLFEDGDKHPLPTDSGGERE